MSLQICRKRYVVTARNIILVVTLAKQSLDGRIMLAVDRLFHGSFLSRKLVHNKNNNIGYFVRRSTDRLLNVVFN